MTNVTDHNSSSITANSAPLNPGVIRIKVGNAATKGEDGPENTIQDQPMPKEEHDRFAKTLGFESYLALFEGSTPLKSTAEGKWLTTALKNKLWVVWNAADPKVVGTYSSQEEAARSLHEGDRA